MAGHRCRRLVQASGVAHAAALGKLARAAVLFFAGTLALRQAGLPAEIVALAFGAVACALALGLAGAAAVGLGGQQVAGRLIERLMAAFDKTPVVVELPGDTSTALTPAVTPAVTPDNRPRNDGPPQQR